MNVGTSNEGCCSYTDSDLNLCGTDVAVSFNFDEARQGRKSTDTEQDLQIPVICFSGLRGGGSYQCPFGSECGTDDDTCSSTEKPPLAKVSLVASEPVKSRMEFSALTNVTQATNVAAADASSTKAASRTTGSPVASGADTPEVSATSGGKGASVALATGSPGQNPSAASKSVAVFSFTIVVASVVMVVVLL